MNSRNLHSKDRFVRCLAGAILIVALVIQHIFEIDMSFFVYLVGLNLFQYGLSGWCPFASYFKKIGWLQN